jgi:hypothetical protein
LACARTLRTRKRTSRVSLDVNQSSLSHPRTHRHHPPRPHQSLAITTTSRVRAHPVHASHASRPRALAPGAREKITQTRVCARVIARARHCAYLTTRRAFDDDGVIVVVVVVVVIPRIAIAIAIAIAIGAPIDGAVGNLAPTPAPAPSGARAHRPIVTP